MKITIKQEVVTEIEHEGYTKLAELLERNQVVTVTFTRDELRNLLKGFQVLPHKDSYPYEYDYRVINTRLLEALNLPC